MIPQALALIALLLVSMSGTAVSALRVEQLSVDSRDHLQVQTSDGRVTVLSDARYRDPKIAPDSVTYGALVIRKVTTDMPGGAIDVCPILRIFRDGRRVRTIDAGAFIRAWSFWNGPREAAIHAGGLHFAGFYELTDIASGRRLGLSQDPVVEASPEWVKALAP